MTEIQLPAPAPTPSRIGQATAVEQSRAVAEVHASVLLARETPRNVAAAQAAIRQSCENAKFAQRAFYSYPRGGSTVTGPSIQMARELARCWGNIQHGINELRRDDVAGESEMLAWAWDVETNTRSSQTFIVPHARDAGRKRQKLTDLRDIYENNANNGARRLREAIFSVLPSWLVDDAKEVAHKTLEAGDGRSLDSRVSEAVAAFAQAGITAERLERKVGRKRAQWTAQDIASLEVVYRSLSRRETTVDEEFPQERVTAADVVDADAAAAEQAAADAETGGE
jgi:hypothetical protein